MWINHERRKGVERAANGNPVTQDAVGVSEASCFDDLVSGVIAIAGIGQGSWGRTAEHVGVGVEGNGRSVHGREPVIGVDVGQGDGASPHVEMVGRVRAACFFPDKPKTVDVVGGACS